MDLRFLTACAAFFLGLVLIPASPAAAEIGSPEAIKIAREDPVAIDQAAKNPGLERRARRVGDRWEVGLYAGDKKVGLVIVDAENGRILESWTGYQVTWKMARGYEGAFGRSLNAPYIFLPLLAIFLAGLIDWRRWRRIVHLDLVVLCLFGISHIFFNRGEIGLSVPLTYPVLIYLAARMLWMGFGRWPSAGGLNPSTPTAWLLILTLFLVGFRIGLNVIDSSVADIGYASVVGADRVSNGEEVYGNFPEDVSEGDTYGPLTYYAYVPFELIYPWSGEWDNLPAAHAAAILFDLGTMGLLYLLGVRLRRGEAGRRLGLILTFGWAAYPYTTMALMTNTNDGLVAMLLVLAFLVAGRPLARGATMAAASLAKFAPLITVPLMARLGASSRTNWLFYALGFVLVAALLLFQTLTGSGLELFYERTLGYQSGRNSPFSLWGQEPALEPLRLVIMGLAVVVALVCLRWPRRLTLVRAAALAAALLILAQLATQHWFYLYIVWFFPLILIAHTGEGIRLTPGAFGSRRLSGRARPEPTPAGSSPPDPQASSRPGHP